MSFACLFHFHIMFLPIGEDLKNYLIYIQYNIFVLSLMKIHDWLEKSRLCKLGRSCKTDSRNIDVAHPQRVFAVVITSEQVFVACQPIRLFHKNQL